MKAALLTALVVASLGPALAQRGRTPEPKSAPAPLPVEVQTWVSRTAVWVGDRIEYVVSLRYPSDVEILPDDLSAERLRLSGLEVLDTVAERDASVSGEVTYRMRYTLVTYSTAGSDLAIAPQPVRYSVRRPGQAGDERLPAGEVTVPELRIGWRSTVAANDPSLGLRDDRALRPLPLRMRVARPLGLALIALAVAPVVLWGADVGRRALMARARRRRRGSVRQRREAFQEIKALDVSSPERRREAFARLETLVREHLHFSSGVAAAALTSAEAAGVALRGRRAVTGEQLARVLAECERAKYAPEPPSVDRWRATLDGADEIVRA